MTNSAVGQNFRVRQVAVTAAALFCAFGTLVGTGVLGERVAETSGGDLAADATLIAPAGPAFAIWSVIYLGLAAYTIWQWRTAHADTTRHRRTAWLAALSMVLNALWLLVTQAGWLWLSVVVIVVLLWACATLVTRLTEEPSRSLVETIVVDGTFGLYLGWVCVAVCANVAATLVAAGVPATGTAPTLVTVVVLLVVIAVAAHLARVLRGNWLVAAGIAWGLAWVAVARLTDRPESVPIGVVAAVAALAVLLVTGLTGGRGARPGRRSDAVRRPSRPNSAPTGRGVPG